jgi:hypothetical protein
MDRLSGCEGKADMSIKGERGSRGYRSNRLKLLLWREASLSTSIE